jgi:uncharacterized protein
MTIPPNNSGHPWPRSKIAISGASGLVGSALTHALEAQGQTVIRLVRRPPRDAGEVAWDPRREQLDLPGLDGVDAVVNLAGENLFRLWTPNAKTRIRASRVIGTGALARALASLPNKPRVMLSGSAVGFYGSRGDEPLDETSPPGDDFLASVCKEWEAATSPASDAGIRVVMSRTGLVLTPRGGALAKMLLPFRLGLGARFGSGNQWMSWISLSDMINALIHLIRNDALSGPVNLVSPNPVTNREFTRTLGYVLGRPTLFVVPRFAAELVFGEMGDSTILASQRARPKRLLESGFEFSEPTLEAALRGELTR